MSTKTAARAVLGLAALTTGVSAVAPAPADAGSYTQTDETLSYYGSGATRGHVRTYVRAYSRDFGCGLQDCASIRDMYGSVNGYKDGNNASLPDAVKMRLVAGFGGVSLSVSLGVSAGGPSGGVAFRDLGASCGTADVQNSGAEISINAPGEICKASTYGWVSNIDVTTGGLYRRGTAWTTVTAFDRVSVGGF
ncbi:MAG TPA: hypothetical protein VNQ33_09845 [Acidimicrobiales bacterium]|nr:hypothetical protein [Acidimicrobiales bacterium]